VPEQKIQTFLHWEPEQEIRISPRKEPELQMRVQKMMPQRQMVQEREHQNLQIPWEQVQEQKNQTILQKQEQEPQIPWEQEPRINLHWEQVQKIQRVLH
jgi:sporulation protein YlmC with PRC-barrel domain